jgi:hypothetical protein
LLTWLALRVENHVRHRVTERRLWPASHSVEA